MTEQAQADLAIDEDCPTALGIAPYSCERLRHRILGMGTTCHAPRSEQRRAHGHSHPNTSLVMVRNQPSAIAASSARVARGASAGLTPPAPGTSASWPFVGW